jgi:carboxylesterase type B
MYILFMVLLFMVVDSLCADYPSVNTKWGHIYGKWSRTVRHQPVANFLGIPYALPPLGDLRFSASIRVLYASLRTEKLVKCEKYM